MRAIETPTARFEITDAGILLAVEKPQQPHTIETTEAALDALAEVAGGERRPMLWDARNLAPGGPETQLLFVDRIRGVASALAIVIEPEDHPKTVEVMAAFVPAVNALLMPTAVFTSPSEAEDWLRESA